MAQVSLHVYQADGYLPPVCMCCGRPATTTVTKRMSWQPQFVGGLIALLMTKYATVQAPFCDQHKGHWFNRNLLTWGTFVLFLAVGAGSLAISANLDAGLRDSVMPVVAVFCGVMLAAWLIILICCEFTKIRPVHITDEEISLTGVAQEFIDAVREEERERRRRRAERRRERARWRDEDDEDDDERPRRRRRSQDDRIQE